MPKQDQRVVSLDRIARKRDLYPSEVAVACPDCGEPAGKRCRWKLQGKSGPMLSAHLPRRRAFARQAAAEKVEAAIAAHLESNEGGMDAGALALEIVEALLIGREKPRSNDDP